MNTSVVAMCVLPLVVGGGVLTILLALARLMPGSSNPGTTAVAARTVVPARGPAYDRLTAPRVRAYRRGLLVMLGLLALTAVEFALAQVSGSAVPLLIIGLAKAALIVQYFMHIYLIWSEEAH